MRSLTITQSITDRNDRSINGYLKDISKIPLIDNEESINLAKQAKQGNKQALDKLITANLRFAVSVAKQYRNKGIPLVDLIQLANLGLWEAAKRWDETRGIKFISYAVWWIRQSIIQGISSECRTIRVPMNQIVCMNKLNKANEKLEQELGRTPSVEELEAETGIDSSKIVLNHTSLNKTLSLNVAFSDDEESGSLVDIIPNTNSTIADEGITNESTIVELNNILNKLSYREGDIIKMIFGIGMLPMTLEEVAARFGIGTERVRQIQHQTLDKLKRLYGNKLRELL